MHKIKQRTMTVKHSG